MIGYYDSLTDSDQQIRGQARSVATQKEGSIARFVIVIEQMFLLPQYVMTVHEGLGGVYYCDFGKSSSVQVAVVASLRQIPKRSEPAFIPNRGNSRVSESCAHAPFSTSRSNVPSPHHLPFVLRMCPRSPSISALHLDLYRCAASSALW